MAATRESYASVLLSAIAGEAIGEPCRVTFEKLPPGVFGAALWRDGRRIYLAKSDFGCGFDVAAFWHEAAHHVCGHIEAGKTYSSRVDPAIVNSPLFRQLWAGREREADKEGALLAGEFAAKEGSDLAAYITAAWMGVGL